MGADVFMRYTKLLAFAIAFWTAPSTKPENSPGFLIRSPVKFAIPEKGDTSLGNA